MFQVSTVLVLLAVLSPLFSVQQNSSSTAKADSRINLDVVVTPKSGPPIADLSQQDFTIFDNKVQRPVVSFQAFAGSQAPVDVILVLDAVNVSYESIAYQRGQIDRFLHANGGQLAHPTALAFLTDTGIDLQKNFSTDGNELSGSFDHYTIGLREIRRSSQYQAIDRFNLSIGALRSLSLQLANRPVRKIVLWVSPGWPLLSGPGIDLNAREQSQIFATIVDLNNQLWRSQITLYSVNPIGAAEGTLRASYYEDFLKGVSRPGQVQIGDLSLQVLAVQSGGLALNSDNDITAQLQECVADTRAYYEVSFDPLPSKTPNEYHQLEVRLAKPGLSVRTRTGYYASPPR